MKINGNPNGASQAKFNEKVLETLSRLLCFFLFTLSNAMRQVKTIFGCCLFVLVREKFSPLFFSLFPFHLILFIRYITIV